jgi:Predicted glycosylase
VLNPSIVRKGNQYDNFYSGFDGKAWHTGLAVSSNGVHWLKQGRVLSPQPDTWEGAYIAANGSALIAGSEFFYWYQAGPRDRPAIGLAQSSDGKAWRKLPAPVLDTGPRGSWDERGVADPYVLRIGDFYYLYYLGQDRARRQRLGVARSHDGVRWEKLRANPILEIGPDGAFDENLGEPAVWQSHSRYWMLYTGRGHRENRRLGLARSMDGVTWEKLPGSFAGPERWNGKVICDPSVLVEGDTIRVWFGGGDVASPDENLHGQIGVAHLIPKS